MRNETSPIERLLTTASARRAARRERRALESYLSQDALSPNARQEIEVILFRQGAAW
ncbi:hypothetical protein I6A60_28920 [Frankia sp. AgB1.9]|uniref:hypothetical protein n=1 Tax=unclassified Frankia TaxID=2632575 RepID=UPI001933452F|nr:MULTISPECIES: hypothetical protein [unclassified Frankia]MBL7486942.1 hypothetical protein [Frankia sp. AgW1.1]MBL7551853.1 hypothetical protein [Frankia sp. AgB1.9]MBL7625360.1 hypothetical protein [Frankia sp. AgB1.8]